MADLADAADRIEWIETACDYCGTEEAAPVLSGPDRVCGLPGEFHVVRCRACGLVRTSPRPTAETLGLAYPSGYEAHQAAPTAEPPEGLLRWALVNLRGYPLGRRAPWPARALLYPAAAWTLAHRDRVRYLPYEGEGRLLDVGCASGRYVARMNAAGWQAEGLDLSAEAVEAGRQAGLELHVGTLPGADLPRGAYDWVTMWHVLEHVPSPLATLRAVREVVRPGGAVAIVSPLINSLASAWTGAAWFGMRELPRHLTHFSQATLARHLEKAGLEVQRARPIRRPTFMRHSFRTLAKETGRPFHRWLGESKAAARLLSFAARALGRTDEVLFVARRPGNASPP